MLVVVRVAKSRRSTTTPLAKPFVARRRRRKKWAQKAIFKQILAGEEAPPAQNGPRLKIGARCGAARALPHSAACGPLQWPAAGAAAGAAAAAAATRVPAMLHACFQHARRACSRSHERSCCSRRQSPSVSGAWSVVAAARPARQRCSAPRSGALR